MNKTSNTKQQFVHQGCLKDTDNCTLVLDDYLEGLYISSVANVLVPN